MKKLILLILTFACTFCNAQINLVPNPSFEDTIECPHFSNQVDKAMGWWPSNTSPDYFHACNWLNGATAVPQNFCGFQYAYHGSAYVGLIAYYRPVNNIRETISCQLISPLQVGMAYEFSFYVSLSGSGGRNIPCNKIGMLFSTVSYDTNHPTPIANYAQFYSDSIISDTLNWVKIEGGFVADSNYTYLSIGNFFDDAHTDTTYIVPSSVAYYYIDGITVKQNISNVVIEPLQNNEIKVYPNPFIEEVNIQFDRAKTNSIAIYDLKGKQLVDVVYPINSQNSIATIDLSYLQVGVYLLKLIRKDNSSKFYKLIKII
ncbi:MAG: T9SS type A sorting domain-containing protein [Bacteroidia bacterium]|nr:T9SS type A sorting domain-containing protein [Bacteroidia bacterium]MCC7514944.1 T9SS type A sorting domain-containing protein [Bacteroidia bacterium]HMW11323.1 T9SS type A sorting domain-containing protein [Bacteroidia bacterium]HMY64715.1 T9SS type A sorting domain-containing protein [Bacteroidia bacterium]HND72564.1 T9SS type A sorting domain-containing protein [Bacteroidia bacterium]